jgi:hypothetical protein
VVLLKFDLGGRPIKTIDDRNRAYTPGSHTEAPRGIEMLAVQFALEVLEHADAGLGGRRAELALILDRRAPRAQVHLRGGLRLFDEAVGAAA